MTLKRIESAPRPAFALAAILLLACTCLLAGCGAGGDVDSTQSTSSDPTEIVEQQSSTDDAQKAAEAEAAKKAEEKAAKEKAAKEKEEAEKKAASQKLAGKTVCIDAGHGDTVSTKSYSQNPYTDATGIVQPLGTSGSKSGNEYEVNLDVAKQLQTMLEAQGAKVVMVRTKNSVVISPKERAEIANDCDADLFVRLHCDSAGSSTRGFLTLLAGKSGYQKDDGVYKTSQKLGKLMHEQIVEELDAVDRGTVVRTDQGGFNWCKVPCVLFEMGNMDNTSDDALLAKDSYKTQLAQAIADATVTALS